MYQLGESGRDAASGEQGLIDPVDEAEGTDRLLGQATKMLRSYLKENVPLETFAGANARWVKRHLWRTCNVIAVTRWLEIIRRTVRGLIPKHSATSEMDMYARLTGLRASATAASGSRPSLVVRGHGPIFTLVSVPALRAKCSVSSLRVRPKPEGNTDFEKAPF